MDNFLVTFNPSKQREYCAEANLERAYTGHAPSLAVVRMAFGEAAANTWLGAQITDLSSFSGTAFKPDKSQYKELCEIIKAQFGFLKVTELMHFFLLFKGGKYGKFYGAVDCMVITEALHEFAKERFETAARFMRERRKREEKEEEARHQAEVESFRNALAVCNMSVAEWNACGIPRDLSHEELAAVGWMYKM